MGCNCHDPSESKNETIIRVKSDISMKKLFLIALSILFFPFQSLLFSQQKTRIEYVSDFININHPQIAYWFLTPEILVNDKYLKDLDEMIDHSRFDFIFLDARNGCRFSDIEKMHPVLEKIVTRAHQRKIKIGYRAQVKRPDLIPEEVTERFIAEAETKLDRSGNGTCLLDAKFVRSRSSFKQEVFKVFVFKKKGNGFYDPATCRETEDYTYSVKDQKIKVNVKAGKEMSGYTAYIMAQFFYNTISNHSPEAVTGVINFINSYSDIPFDGVMLDEYSNPQIIPPWKMMFKFGNYRLRSYSVPMAGELEARTGKPAFQTLFDMRYAPSGKSEIRIKATNSYMDLMREGAMHVEEAMYKRAKEVYGQECLIGAHNTFHNSLVNDEIWATGLKWWSIPRDVGFSDENTPLPTQMGIAISYPAHVMYNMYYDRHIRQFTSKALSELRYGIRTFYHAFNDTQWGIGLEKKEAYSNINPVEDCVRLMNRFNPALPDIKLLVIFGNEALQNWYPNTSCRGRYDINDRLKIEEKAVKIWKAGYRNALVPSDLINSGKLKLNADYKPVMNGHIFDAIVFLYPQYSKEPVIKFLEEYVNNGGKLMMEGKADYNFSGIDISDRFAATAAKSTVTGFSLKNIGYLGIAKNRVEKGCKNEDGSFVFTNTKSLRKKKQTIFSVSSGKNCYSAKCCGFAAFLTDQQGGFIKFTCAGFKELKLNGEIILSLDHPADLYVEKRDDCYQITVKGQEETNHFLVNKL
jgi:hypothetical protein